MSDKVKEFMHKLHTPKNNGNIPFMDSNYTPIIIFKMAYCKNCKATIQFPNDTIVCRSYDELFRRAELEHRKAPEQTKIICTDSQLLMTYENAFILTALLIDMQDETIIK